MRLMTVVAGSDDSVKERIGSVGGLRACMNCAHVDMRETGTSYSQFEVHYIDHSSALRESALFTLSVLLKNHPSNQQRVRDLGDTPVGVLDAQGVLQPFEGKNTRQI